MSNSVFSFVPELYFTNQKDTTRCRIFHDACAVIDARDSLRVIAARGMEDQIGKPLISPNREDLFRQSRVAEFLNCKETCLLLPDAKGSLLLFSAWYPSTGLLLGVRLQSPEGEVRKAIDFAQRNAIKPVFFGDERENVKSDLLRDVEELFYYTTRILTPKDELWNHCLTVANFVGCRLEQLSLPISFPNTDEDSFHRFTSFLVCCLMEMRHRYGKTGILKTDSKNENVGKVQMSEEDALKISVEQIVTEKQESQSIFSIRESIEQEEFPFASLPAFCNFSFEKSGENLIFSAALSSRSGLHATHAKSLVERFSLSFCVCKAS